jgi:hypothetical protein
MGEGVDLSVLPTPDQLRRFRALSPAERYRWFVGLLTTTHGLASPEAREGWRALKQAQSGGFLSVVSTFARALDRADFDDLSRCLSPECLYEARDAVLQGVDAVVAAYSVDQQRVARVDRLRRRSRVEGVAPGVAVITCEHRFEHRGVQHCFRYRQQISVGRSRLVERIVDDESLGRHACLDHLLQAADLTGSIGESPPER